jgi:PAS domain S-box-containing protein
MTRPDSIVRSSSAFGSRSSRLRRRIYGTVAGLLLGIWALLGYSSWQQFRIAHESATSTASTIAKLVEAWALSTLIRVDDLADSLEMHMASGAGAISDLLKRHRANKPDLFRIVDVLDIDGESIATTDPGHDAVLSRNYDSDRETPNQVTIGLPRLVGERMLVPLARALRDGDGRSLGTVVVEADPDYFAGFYSDLNLPKGAAVQLFRADGPMIARNRAALGTIGRSYPDIELWSQLSEEPSGTFTSTDNDGIARVTSYRANGSIPIVVAIGLARDEVESEPHRRLVLFGLIAATLSWALLFSISAVLRQLHQRMAAEQALAVSAAGVRSVGSGIVIVDRHDGDRIVQCNPAFLRLARRAHAEVIGARWDAITGIDAAPLPRRATDADQATELQLRRSDGSMFWAEIRAALIRDELGDSNLGVLVVTDVDARKATEAELIRAKDEAEAANLAKSDFLANMSHELRTPLNAIIGFSEMIEREMLGPVANARYREYAGDIGHSAGHLLSIIQDILDFAKIEATTLQLEEDDVDLREIVRSCVRFVAARAERAHIPISTNVPDEASRIYVDELRLKQVLLNLLTNAVKFSAAGMPIALTAAGNAQGGIDITVADRGCGMEPHEVEIALQPFRQLASAAIKSAEGTGLGLPLAKRLVELHGGQLLIDSAVERGTSVTVRLPAHRVLRASAAA